MRESSRNIPDREARSLCEIPSIVDFEDARPACGDRCEERDGLNWSIMIAVANLTGHLWKMVRVKVNSGAPEQIHALQTEQRSLAANLECLLMRWKTHRASHGC